VAIKSRRYAIVVIFIIAAILTPPDVVSQCILAAPLLALFELALLFMKKEPKPQNV
jgi:sec-independent protein translocase protein TatC